MGTDIGKRDLCDFITFNSKACFDWAVKSYVLYEDSQWEIDTLLTKSHRLLDGGVGTRKRSSLIRSWSIIKTGIILEREEGFLNGMSSALPDWDEMIMIHVLYGCCVYVVACNSILSHSWVGLSAYHVPLFSSLFYFLPCLSLTLSLLLSIVLGHIGFILNSTTM